MDFFSKDLISFTQIIFVNIVLSADNIILISVTASKFSEKIKKKILFYGAFFAVFLRIIFTSSVTFVFQFKGIKTIGGILLIWVCYQAYKDIVNKKNNQNLNKNLLNIPIKSRIFKAIITIAITDIFLGLDNIIAVAGVAQDNYFILISGLIISIAAITIFSNFIAKYIKRYKWIAVIGLFVIISVAVKMIYNDFEFLI